MNTESKLNIVSLLTGSIHRISHVYRYSSIPTLRRESTAEHMWFVSFYSFMIAKDFEKTTGHKIDYGKLLSRSLLHDVEESNSGDVIRVVKHSSPELRDALEKVSCSIVKKIEGELGVDFFHIWESAKADDLEGWIVRISDFLSVVGYALEEIKSGNSHMRSILPEVRDYLVDLSSSLKQPLLRRYVDQVLVFIREQVD